MFQYGRRVQSAHGCCDHWQFSPCDKYCGVMVWQLKSGFCISHLKSLEWWIVKKVEYKKWSLSSLQPTSTKIMYFTKVRERVVVLLIFPTLCSIRHLLVKKHLQSLWQTGHDSIPLSVVGMSAVGKSTAGQVVSQCNPVQIPTVWHRYNYTHIVQQQEHSEGTLEAGLQ